MQKVYFLLDILFIFKLTFSKPPTWSFEMTPQEHFDPIKPDTETAYQSESQLQANAGLNQNEAQEEIKHTPGPWRQAGACIYRESQPIGRVYSVSAEDEGSTLANACLMAAAPDLLEALKSVRATFGDTASQCVINKRICWVMDSAIAKATRGRVLR